MSKCRFVARELQNTCDHQGVDEGDVDVADDEIPCVTWELPNVRGHHDAGESDVDINAIERPVRRSGAPERVRSPRS